VTSANPTVGTLMAEAVTHRHCGSDVPQVNVPIRARVKDETWPLAPPLGTFLNDELTFGIVRPSGVGISRTILGQYIGLEKLRLALAQHQHVDDGPEAVFAKVAFHLVLLLREATQAWLIALGVDGFEMSFN
jgi:hypothetical protein